ncbi:MAG TPA: hypothetical protein PLY87_18305 [Planctomycetaceae bacterium]|nr:hypothetical protein [Planctomycetaceae bacterium]HQZ67053.1 hypothetical protein [Planctomycetaceae bacterium]
MTQDQGATVLPPAEADMRANRNASQTLVQWTCLAMAAIVLLLPGCAATSYSYGFADDYLTSQELQARTQTQIERGKPNAVIDSMGWVWGIPGKITLFDRRVENHRIDQRTENEIAAYLNDNELSTVKVRLNQYHPTDDWGRLVANKSVGAGWRYTIGTLSVLGETVFPGRVFGSDHFNPFTNTIHIYSNIPAIALHEAGHSKDFAQRKWKGTYAATYALPFVPLYQEAIATNDALGYVKENRDLAAQREACEILYPAYGTYVGSAISGQVAYGYLFGVIGGHAAGRWKSWRLQNTDDVNNGSFVHERRSPSSLAVSNSARQLVCP